jgi:hypothetical protein
MLTLLTITLFVFSLRIVVSNAYCVAYLFFMSSSSCVAYVASFSALSIFDWPGNIDPKPGMSHYIPCLIAE